MDLFMRIFTIGTVTLKQGEIKDAKSFSIGTLKVDENVLT